MSTLAVASVLTLGTDIFVLDLRGLVGLSVSSVAWGLELLRSVIRQFVTPSSSGDTRHCASCRQNALYQQFALVAEMSGIGWALPLQRPMSYGKVRRLVSTNPWTASRKGWNG